GGRIAEDCGVERVRRRLDDRGTAMAAVKEIRARDPELSAMVQTTFVPTILRAGNKINVIPNSAEAQIDVQRMPGETREEVLARFKQVINDSAVEVTFAPGPQMPVTEASP